MSMRFKMAGGPRGSGNPFIAMSFGRGGGRSWGGDWDFGNWSFDGGGRGGRGGGGGGRGGRGRRRMFDSGELRIVLLALIEKEPRHGYDLIKAIEEMTGGDYAPSPGVVYPTLSLLEDAGLIASVETDGARKAFRITDAGIAELSDKRDEADALLARLSEAGEEREQRAGGPQIGRAVGNLMAAMAHRLASGEADAEFKHRVAEILDEAAQKIERL
ncbi:PadR family transcriptional regulator [Blastomonas fulva]|nr:PadR family transcriptional regulator [Blastomonas fulva]